MPKVGKDTKHIQKTIAFMKWLKGEMAVQDVCQKDLANEIGMKQQTFSYHITNHVPFDYPQLIGIFDYLHTDANKIKDLLRSGGRND